MFRRLELLWASAHRKAHPFSDDLAPRSPRRTARPRLEALEERNVPGSALVGEGGGGERVRR